MYGCGVDFRQRVMGRIPNVMQTPPDRAPIRKYPIGVNQTPICRFLIYNDPNLRVEIINLLVFGSEGSRTADYIEQPGFLTVIRM